MPEGSGVILIDPGGRVLLQQRDDDTPPAGVGRWAIPGGGREGGESPRDTALREFEEETGVSLQRLRFFETATFDGPFERPAAEPWTIHAFFADDDVARERIVVNEGLDFRYFTPEEALALPMNPGGRGILERFLASDKYRGTVATKAAYREGVGVIEIDRWGRLLLQLRDADLPPERFPDTWCIPGGLMERGEPPDAAALREFEEETGHLLQELKLYRLYRRPADLPTLLSDVYHVYYIDADLPEDMIDVNEGQAFRYFAPAELEALNIPPHARTILDQFVSSPAYRAMFH
ncbi:NUDIX hydrolase [bacterium]|jgi:8-oxo-dGTP diphosphatase|nr:NUDIX hydrolase [bacterium]